MGTSEEGVFLIFFSPYLAFVRSELTAVASLLFPHLQSHLMYLRVHLSKHMANVCVHPFGVHFVLTWVSAEKSLLIPQ